MPRQRDVPADFVFGGFTKPGYTPIPDQFFDELLAAGLLNTGELRVALYLMRRTFGWKKDSDTVSLTQIVDGIVRKDGTRVDWGAGVARSTAVEAIKSLEAKGILRVVRTESAEHGCETNTYALRFQGDAAPAPLPPPPSPNTGLGESEYRTRGSRNAGRGLVRMPDPQETTVQEPIQQETVDSNHTSLAKNEGGYDGPHSPYIAAIIQDHSRELGDAAHWPSNVTQALRLWQASGGDEAAFVAHLHAARARVRAYQGKQGTGHIANKMAYYFTCLRDLVAVAA